MPTESDLWATLAVTVNDCPQARLTLEVRPAGRPPFRAETRCAVSDASRPKFVPGATVNVRFGSYGSPEVAVDYAP